MFAIMSGFRDCSDIFREDAIVCDSLRGSFGNESALLPLDLGSVPQSAISSIVDTRGTAYVRNEWTDNTSRRQL